MGMVWVIRDWAGSVNWTLMKLDKLPKEKRERICECECTVHTSRVTTIDCPFLCPHLLTSSQRTWNLRITTPANALPTASNVQWVLTEEVSTKWFIDISTIVTPVSYLIDTNVLFKLCPIKFIKNDQKPKPLMLFLSLVQTNHCTSCPIGSSGPQIDHKTRVPP